jgi:hypothetical protein
MFRGLVIDIHEVPLSFVCPEFNVQPEAVEMLTQPGQGGHLQGTGMANVQFPSPAAAEAAQRQQHHKPFGTRFIECLPLTPQMPSTSFAGHLLMRVYHIVLRFQTHMTIEMGVW